MHIFNLQLPLSEQIFNKPFKTVIKLEKDISDSFVPETVYVFHK